MKILITGANGHLGVRLLAQLRERHDVVAAVRSDRARDTLLGNLEGEAPAVHIVDYTDAESLVGPATGCDVIVHLPGIIKETANNSYQQAHEGASMALVAAANKVGVKKLVHVSILGSRPGSRNACFESRARAEKVLLDSGIPTLIIQVAMVLGEGDYASRALRNKACRALNLEIRAASLEQPIYAGDVIDALEKAVESGLTGNLELAGPESLPRRELIERAGRIKGRRPRTISVPLAIGTMMAWILEANMSNPPVTRAMLGVLDHDDRIDPAPACELLDLRLTSVDEMLERTII